MSSSSSISRYSLALTWARQNYHAINEGEVTFQRTRDDGVTEDVTAEFRKYLYYIIEIVEGQRVRNGSKCRRV